MAVAKFVLTKIWSAYRIQKLFPDFNLTDFSSSVEYVINQSLEMLDCRV